MAFRTKFKTQNKLSKDLVFEGGIQSYTRYIIVKEFLKYILYERQQIPVPYEQVKRCYKTMEEQNQTEGKKSFVSKMECQKISKLICSLEDLFGKLMEAFDVCPEIRQILILLGGTIISPKESYIINFPPYNPEACSLSSEFCVRYMLRELISQDLVGKLKDLRKTNAVIMVKAPQDSGISWFLPKPNFTVPERGEHFYFNLISNPNSDVFIHDLTHDEHEIEISGIEPFDISRFDMSLEEQVMKMFISSEHDDSYRGRHDLSVIVSVEQSRRLSLEQSKHLGLEQSRHLSTVSQCFNSLSDEEKILHKLKECNMFKEKVIPVVTVEKVIPVVTVEKVIPMVIVENVTINLDISSDDDTILQKTIDSNKSVNDDNCIWFQAPYFVKGYKDKSSRKSTVF